MTLIKICLWLIWPVCFFWISKIRMIFFMKTKENINEFDVMAGSDKFDIIHGSSYKLSCCFLLF